MFDVITIGAATRDVFVKSAALDIQESNPETHALEACFPMGAKIDIDELVLETGGGATNAAATLARLDFSAATICAIGKDSSARDVLSAFDEDKIATDFIQRFPEKKTGYSIIIVAGSGERTILVHRGASRSLNAKRVDWDQVQAKWIYITSLGGDMDLLSAALKHAEKNNIKVAWNPGNGELKLGLDKLKTHIEKVDVFNLNLEEAAALVETNTSELADIIEKLRPLPKKVLLITDGPRGAYAAEPTGDVLHAPTIDVPRINTTGAGDAFGSAFVAGMLQQDDIKYGLAVGLWNATGCIQEVGAKRGLLESFPSEKDIQKVEINLWK